MTVTMPPDDARCITCDYPLRGLSSRQCPECGRAFDPDEPQSMRLPGPRLSWLVRRLARPGGRDVRAVPIIATLLILCGPRLPGWNNAGTFFGIVLWVALIVGHAPVLLLRRLLAHRGEHLRHLGTIDRRFERTAAVALLVSVLLLAFPLPMYVMFRLSRPAFDRATTEILEQPFSVRPAGGRWIGLYYVSRMDRCPHGLEFYVTTFDRDVERGNDVSFVYKDEPGDCSRHRAPGHSLGGYWYAPPFWEDRILEHRVDRLFGILDFLREWL